MPPALRLLLSAVIAYVTWWLIVIAQAFFPIFDSVIVEEAIAWVLALGLGAAFWIASRPDAGFDLKTIAGTTLKSGLICFLLGFVGPMILAPGANQGPMVGFFTGPVGLVLGGLYAFIRALLRRQRTQEET